MPICLWVKWLPGTPKKNNPMGKRKNRLKPVENPPFALPLDEVNPIEAHVVLIGFHRHLGG